MWLFNGVPFPGHLLVAPLRLCISYVILGHFLATPLRERLATIHLHRPTGGPFALRTTTAACGEENRQQVQRTCKQQNISLAISAGD